jgi:hypothetical protein
MGPEEFMRPKASSRRNGIGPAGMRVLCAAALSALALCRPGAASEPTITVEGNRRIDAQAIREHFHASSDALLTPAAIDSTLKELYQTGLFEDVKIVWSGAHVIVTVVEAPLIQRLRFEGNKQVKDKDLSKEIDLKPRSPMTKAAVHEDVARIIEIYRRNGRYEVQVTPNTIARREGRVRPLPVRKARWHKRKSTSRDACSLRRDWPPFAASGIRLSARQFRDRHTAKCSLTG